MIQCRCPSCGTVLTATAEQCGSEAPCPGCGQRLLIPPPVRTDPGPVPVPSLEPYRAPPTIASAPPRPDALPEPPPPPRPARPDEQDDDRRRTRDDDEEDHPRRRRRWDEYQPCPRCGCTDRPYQTKKLGTAGIALLIAGIIFWPLLIVCIFMQETWETCPRCGERIRQIGSGL